MVRTLNSTPQQDGYRMPGEFEPHAGCWMLWPQRTDTWREQARPAQAAFARVAEAIAHYEPVTVGVSAQCFDQARAMLPDAVSVVELSSNDAWMRDVGPTFVVNDHGGLRGVDWGFNAWGGEEGGLYSPWDQDERVARKVLEIAGADRYAAPFILEGGSIHVDGEGTLITTEECLLNPNRNPGLSRAEIEAHLREYLSVETIIWLGQGVIDDETDGHVDNLCCFIRPGVVALTWTDDPNDPQYAVSQDAYARLSSALDARGRHLEIHKLHQPGPLYIHSDEASGLVQSGAQGAKPRKAGDRLAASYVNFYIANGAVIIPTFNDPHDAPALETLSHLFPNREIIGLPGREILLGGGNIHCITQQQPVGGRAGA